jgi:hypothetical protein
MICNCRERWGDTMFRSIQAVLGIMLSVLVTVSWWSTAGADDSPSVSIRGGATTTLSSGDEKINPKSTGLKGSITVKDSPTSPKFRLEYTAPQTKTDFSEDVVYTVGATERKSVVTVQAPDFPPDTYERAFRILFIAFVVALLLESGLTVLFNWRPFLMLFDARGARTVVSVIFAYIFVRAFHLNIVQDLVVAYTSQPINDQTSSKFASEFISALILAGGSSGVNKLLVAMGYREMKTAEQVVSKPPPQVAWIAVALTRRNAKGPVHVMVGQNGAQAVAAGTITSSSRLMGLFGYFIRDYGRFPPSGGHQVDPDVPVTVQLIGEDQNHQPLASKTWAVPGLAKGAIVDIRLEL